MFSSPTFGVNGLACRKHAGIDWRIAKELIAVDHNPVQLWITLLWILVRESQLSVGSGELFDERLQLSEVSQRDVLKVQDVLVDLRAELCR